jgi:hypothetical protein
MYDAYYPFEPRKCFADVVFFEARRRELLGYELAVVRNVGLPAILEDIDEDIVHVLVLLLS